MCAAIAVEAAKLEAVFSRYPTVVAAWLFGSAQTGRTRPGSDLDIGVLFTEPPDLDTLTGLQANLAATLGGEVDLVPLNQAGPILRFEAISGRSLYCRDVGRRAVFASFTAREYESAMALLARGLE